MGIFCSFHDAIGGTREDTYITVKNLFFSILFPPSLFL